MFLNGLLQVRDACLQTVDSASRGKSSEIIVVGFRIHYPRALQGRLLLRGELDPDLTGNGTGHLILQPQHIAQVTLITLGPQVFVGGPVDQLSRDAHVVAGSHYRALHHGIDIQLAGNLGLSLIHI